MTKNFTHTATCPLCHGNGFYDIAPDGKKFPPLSQWGSSDQKQSGCEQCGGNSYQLGSGRISVNYEVSDNVCLECKGVGHFESSKLEHSMDSSGRGWRETKVTQTPCPSCFGQKKMLHRIETFPCSECKGLGVIEKWSKPFLSFLGIKGEVQTMTKCPKCKGSGTETRTEVFAHGHVAR